MKSITISLNSAVKGKGGRHGGHCGGSDGVQACVWSWCRLQLILISTLGVEDQTCLTARFRDVVNELPKMGPKPEEFPFRDDTIVVFVEEVENCCRDSWQR